MQAHELHRWLFCGFYRAMFRHPYSIGLLESEAAHHVVDYLRYSAFSLSVIHARSGHLWSKPSYFSFKEEGDGDTGVICQLTTKKCRHFRSDRARMRLRFPSGTTSRGSEFSKISESISTLLPEMCYSRFTVMSHSSSESEFGPLHPRVQLRPASREPPLIPFCGCK
jgi:hypothetical protein